MFLQSINHLIEILNIASYQGTCQDMGLSMGQRKDSDMHNRPVRRARGAAYGACNNGVGGATTEVCNRGRACMWHVEKEWLVGHTI